MLERHEEWRGGVVDLVIFDCDGVLVDSEVISCRIASKTFERFGFSISYEDYVQAFAGKSRAAVIKYVEGQLEVKLPSEFSDALEAEILSAFSKELKPISNVLLAIEASPFRCIASGSSLPRIRHSLQVAGLSEQFDAQNIFNAAMVPNGKPAPDLFLLAAKQMGRAPERCLVIEDSLAGVQAAKTAGMRCFGFTGGQHIRDPLHGNKLISAGASRAFSDMKALAANLHALTLAF